MTELPAESLRIAALEQAVLLNLNSAVPDILDVAEVLLIWLRSGGRPVTLGILVGAPQGKEDNTTTSPKGPATMASMNTGQKIQITADPEDAAGFDVDVPVTFVSTDETVGSIVNIPEDPKSVWVVSGAPGSTLVTATVTRLDGTELTGSLAVDVVTGDVVAVNIVAGDPVDE